MLPYKSGGNDLYIYVQSMLLPPERKGTININALFKWANEMFGLLFINFPIYQTNTYSHNSNMSWRQKKKEHHFLPDEDICEEQRITVCILDR